MELRLGVLTQHPSSYDPVQVTLGDLRLDGINRVRRSDDNNGAVLG